jgi:hypothetical protein
VTALFDPSDGRAATAASYRAAATGVAQELTTTVEGVRG